MRGRHRSGGRIMLRGKPGLILLVILLTVGVFVAYYTWFSSPSSSPARSKFEKYRSKNNLPSRNMNLGLRYGGQALPARVKGPQIQDPPNFENRILKGGNKFGGINMRPLAPPEDLEGPTKDNDEDYKFKGEDGEDFDDKDDFIDKEKSREEDYSRGTKDEERKKEKFQQVDERRVSGVLYPQLYVAPDPKYTEQFQKMEHIVHLDLKGAPPKIDYMISLLPIMKKLGATGLLLEYEDMFPYHDELRILASDSPYSTPDILRLLNAAKNENFKVIPLIQTFGHMEFVLKYAKYQDLRENPDTPQVITPVSQRTYQLIAKMIDQVMTLHSDAPYIHIGCDEVYGLGEGKVQALMKSGNKTKEQIFLDHVKQVAGSITKKYPKTRVIMWDDELRHKIPLADIEKSGLGSLVELMVWAYVPQPKDILRDEIWGKYGKHFSGVWAASSFKGATGSAQFFTNVSYHLENHINWIQIVKDIRNVVPPEKFRGFALTGWQRYDHFAALCELLPSSIPSLAVSLQTVYNGGFTPEIHNTVGKILNCTKLVDLDFPKKVDGKYLISQDCKFPGSDFYYAMQSLWVEKRKFTNDLGLQSRIQGWLTDFHVKHHFSSPGHMKILQRKLSKILDSLSGLQSPVQNSLQNIYDKNTIDEWIAVHLTQMINDLKVKLNKATVLLMDKTWQKRPVESGQQAGLSQQRQTFPQGQGFRQGQGLSLGQNQGFAQGVGQSQGQGIGQGQGQGQFQVQKLNPSNQFQQQPKQTFQGQQQQSQKPWLPGQQQPQKQQWQQQQQQLQQAKNSALQYNGLNNNAGQKQLLVGRPQNQPNGQPANQANLHGGLNSNQNPFTKFGSGYSQQKSQTYSPNNLANVIAGMNPQKTFNQPSYVNTLQKSKFGAVGLTYQGQSQGASQQGTGNGANFKPNAFPRRNSGSYGDMANKMGNVQVERTKDSRTKDIYSQEKGIDKDFNNLGSKKNGVGQYGLKEEKTEKSLLDSKEMDTKEKERKGDQNLGLKISSDALKNVGGQRTKLADFDKLKKEEFYDDHEDKQHV